MSNIKYPTDLSREWTATEAETALRAMDRMRKSNAVNFDPGAGRFIGPEDRQNRTESPAFSNLFIQEHNSGGAIVSAGAHHYNSSTYGGIGAADDSAASSLLSELRLVSNDTLRRYVPSFHVAQITAGSGTSNALDSMYLAAVPHAGAIASVVSHTGVASIGFYVRKVSGDLGLYAQKSGGNYPDREYRLDGVDITLPDDNVASQELEVISDTDWHFYSACMNWNSFMGVHVGIYSTDASVIQVALPYVTPGSLVLDEVNYPIPAPYVVPAE